MKTPSPEEVTAIKADVVKRFPGCVAKQITLEAPISAVVVMASFDLPSWDSYVDAQGRDLDTAHVSALVDRRLWPSLDEVTAMRERWPAAPRKVAAEIHKAAGEVAGSAVSVAFSLEALPRGLTAEKGAALIEAAGGAALWTVQLPGVPNTLVMQTPLADVYLAAKAANATANERNVGRISALLTYALEAVVWSSEPIDQLLNRLPGLAADVRRAYLDMGGEGAATRSKSL